MEKISPIIANSARVASADVSEAGPVRPGTPGFGRAQAEKSVRTPDMMSTADRGINASRQLQSWRDKESRRAAQAKEVSDGFFMKTKAKPVVAEVPVKDEFSIAETGRLSSEPRASRPTGFNTNELRGREDFARAHRTAVAEIPVEQPEGLYPPGYFLDREA